jgi:hypothetical protein
MRWIAALIACSGCNAIFGLAPTSIAADGGGADDSAHADAAPIGPWASPTPLDVASSSAAEDDPALSPDGLELYFSYALATPKDIMRARRATVDDPWQPAAPIAIDTNASEGTPRLGEAATSLYFSSNAIAVDDDVYVSFRVGTSDDWGPPSQLVVVNSGANDRTATPCADEQQYLFASDRAGSSDLYGTLPSGIYALGELNDPSAQEISPWVSEDCLTLWFASNVRGTFDLYTATRSARDGPFDSPVLVTELSTDTVDETDPFLTPDQRHIYFTSGTDIVESTR